MVECRSLQFVATKCRSLGAALPHVTPLPWTSVEEGNFSLAEAGEKKQFSCQSYRQQASKQIEYDWSIFGAGIKK